MIKVLELFCGTKSIGKCCNELGWESISVDLESKFNPTHLCDIMDFNYKQYSPDYFDIVWASPPCTEYSHLQNCWINRMRKGEIFTKEIWENNMKEADKIVLKTLEIINYFNPEYYFIENPQTGKMKEREIMKDIPFYDVDYCKYSLWGYKKRTRIWTNKKNWNNLLCNNDCDNMIEIKTNGAKHTSGKLIKSDTRKLHSNPIGDNNKCKEIKKQHSKVLGNGYEIIDGEKILVNTKAKRQLLKSKIEKTGEKQKSLGNGTSQEDRYRIPPDLIYSLFLD